MRTIPPKPVPHFGRSRLRYLARALLVSLAMLGVTTQMVGSPRPPTHAPLPVAAPQAA